MHLQMPSYEYHLFIFYTIDESCILIDIMYKYEGMYMGYSMCVCMKSRRNVHRISACKSCQKLSAKNMCTKTKQIDDADASAAAVSLVIVVAVFCWCYS